MSIPDKVSAWFKQKNWHLHDYQQQMFAAFAQKRSTLLIAPTGGGKTLASFLPCLMDIAENPAPGLHTIYISPLKALTYDIERNLSKPIAEMDLNVSVESRTGDTTSARRQRQRKKPPHILLITPESLMLMLSYPDAATLFASVKTIIIDELHQFINSKRGDMTALALAMLDHHAKPIKFGLSATIAQPEAVAKWLGSEKKPAAIISAAKKLLPHVDILNAYESIPYTGIMAKYAIPAIYHAIQAATMTIIFVNTRAQAEFIFNQLWLINELNLPIAIYHGSLNKEQRFKTEQLTVEGKLKAIVATSALELGIDWNNVDLVLQVGAPKGVSRLLQRIGRSNHRFDQRSHAILVPANCFELLECQAAITEIAAGHLDGGEILDGAWDVVIQFITNCACSAPISEAKVYRIVKQAYVYRKLSKALFARLFQFAIDGGYVLKHYERYRRLKLVKHKLYAIDSPRVMRRHRQNIGTIIEAARLKVKLKNKRGSKYLGEVEESFVQQLTPGDTFLFAGLVLAFVGIRDMAVEVKKAIAKDPMLPSYAGGTMPMSTHLADAVAHLIHDHSAWHHLPPKVQNWLSLQERFSQLPSRSSLLVETFLYNKTHQTVFYTFEGRSANNSLAILLTRQMEKNHLKPVSFTVTDYGLVIASLKPLTEQYLNDFLSTQEIQHALAEWLSYSPSIKRAFRHVAIIAGLTERQTAGTRKSMRQITFSTDLIYDVLQRHEPGHILLEITRTDVERGIIGLDRLMSMLKRFQKQMRYVALDKPSPMSLPVLMAIKTEHVQQHAMEELLTQLSQEAEANYLMSEIQKDVG